MLLGYLGGLGLANTTFGDADFAWVGILLGTVAGFGIGGAWVLAIAFVALAFALGIVFPILRPDYGKDAEAGFSDSDPTDAT